MKLTETTDVAAVAMVSPDPIPLRWEHFEASDGECLLYRLDEPPHKGGEMDALKRMWGDA